MCRLSTAQAEGFWKNSAVSSHCKKGGKLRRKLIRAKKKRLSELKHQIQVAKFVLASLLS
jgi:hypothetical protein